MANGAALKGRIKLWLNIFDWLDEAALYVTREGRNMKSVGFSAQEAKTMFSNMKEIFYCLFLSVKTKTVFSNIDYNFLQPVGLDIH